MLFSHYAIIDSTKSNYMGKLGFEFLGKLLYFYSRSRLTLITANVIAFNRS